MYVDGLFGGAYTITANDSGNTDGRNTNYNCSTFSVGDIIVVYDENYDNNTQSFAVREKNMYLYIGENNFITVKDGEVVLLDDVTSASFADSLLGQNCFIVLRPSNSDVTKFSEFEKAFKEVAYAYYMRGGNLQYSQRKFTLFPPEEATSQNTNYIICSSFVRNVYNELLGIKTPRLTSDLLKYSKDYFGSPEVIGYGYKNIDKNTDVISVMKLIDNPEGIQNPSLNDIIPYLRVGDIMTYTGHTILVYDLIRDENDNIIDCYILESGAGDDSRVNSKIWQGGNYLYYNTIKSTELINDFDEGSIHLTRLTKLNEWNNINRVTEEELNNSNNVTKKEYSILRFVDKDSFGNAILTYSGKIYEDNDYDKQELILSNENKDRLKYRKLYIEKTVDVHADDLVVANDELTYKIVVKNNSENNYDDEINVTEKLSDYVTYKKYNVNKSNAVFNSDLENQTLTWNIGKLKSGDEVIIKYTVVVKEGYYGEIIESTGKVENIDSAVVRNKIGNNLTDSQSHDIEEKYNTLKSQYSGKELINEIYKQAFGIDLKIDKFDITDLIYNTKLTRYEADTIGLNTGNSFYNLVLNKYWSCMCNDINSTTKRYNLKYWKEYYEPDRRADTVYGENFKTGDILIYTNSNDVYFKKINGVDTPFTVTYENGEYAYIYIEGKGFVGVNYGNDGVSGGQDDRNEFVPQYYNDNELALYTKKSNEEFLKFANYQTLLAKDYYVILRPSIAVDLVPMELDVNYSDKNLTNKDVTVTITSNEEMWSVDDWTLSEDKKTLTKTYTENTSEELKVYDYGGNEKIAEIKIENIDKIAPKIQIEYSTTDLTNKDVIVTITADKIIRTVEGWTLSSDMKQLTKIFKENDEEEIVITDEVGNNVTAKIKVENIVKQVIITIKENPQTIKESVQIADKKYIIVDPKTKAGDILNDLITNFEEYKLVIKDGDTKASEAKTSQVIAVEGSDEETNMVIIVKGDVDSDGEVSFRDILKLNNYRLYKTLNEKNWTSDQKVAFKVVKNRKVTSSEIDTLAFTDIVALNNYRLRN